MPHLTEDQWKSLILRACDDDGTVQGVWGMVWERRAHLDQADPSGDLRYYAVLRDALDLLIAKAASSVSASEAGQSGSYNQHFDHLQAMRKQADEDYRNQLKALTLSAEMQMAVMTAYSLTPVQPGYFPDPASPGYLGDPRYVDRWRVR